jgi:hypothetical protein
VRTIIKDADLMLPGIKGNKAIYPVESAYVCVRGLCQGFQTAQRKMFQRKDVSAQGRFSAAAAYVSS